MNNKSVRDSRIVDLDVFSDDSAVMSDAEVAAYTAYRFMRHVAAVLLGSNCKGYFSYVPEENTLYYSALNTSAPIVKGVYTPEAHELVRKLVARVPSRRRIIIVYYESCRAFAPMYNLISG